MKNSLKSTVLLTVISVLSINTDAILDDSIIGVGTDYVLDAVIEFPILALTPPSNTNGSIMYLLYTPSNKNEPCLIQPNARQFDKCLFNATYETKFLIHGFAVKLPPGNLFDDLKDALLKHDNYNVIIVDWTLYNSIPFKFAYRNGIIVGEKVGEMMKFIEAYKKISLKTIHCIGHSLGAHICGLTGRKVRTIARITGLDPGGISKKKSLKPNIRLRYTDADFVDVIHTSDISSDSGLGFLQPVGHQDYYVNGGVKQPRCVAGNSYKVFKGKTLKVLTNLDKILCNHFIVIEYFTNSLKPDCKFVATECENYSDFKKGKCESRTKTEMGFFAKKIEKVKPMTKFYLETQKFPPYCLGLE